MTDPVGNFIGDMSPLGLEIQGDADVAFADLASVFELVYN